MKVNLLRASANTLEISDFFFFTEIYYKIGLYDVYFFHNLLNCSYLKWLIRWILFSLAFPVLFLNSSPHNSQLGLWSLTSMLSWTGKAAKSVISLKSMVTSCGLNLTSFFSRTISRSRNEGINSDNLTWWSCMTRRSKSWWLQIKCLNRDCFFSYLENESVFYRHLKTKSEMGTLPKDMDIFNAIFFNKSIKLKNQILKNQSIYKC